MESKHLSGYKRQNKTSVCGQNVKNVHLSTYGELSGLMLQLCDEASCNIKPRCELWVTQMFFCVKTKYLWHEEWEAQQSLQPHALGFSSQNFSLIEVLLFHEWCIQKLHSLNHLLVDHCWFFNG